MNQRPIGVTILAVLAAVVAVLAASMHSNSWGSSPS